MNKFLKQVTITGADNSIDFHDLYKLSEKYPFVEWGILLSKNSEGYNRFPTWDWIEGLINESPPKVSLSGHLCGIWARDIIHGGTLFQDSHEMLSQGFKRFQINLHGQLVYPTAPERYIESLHLLTCLNKQQVIFQWDGVNTRPYQLARGPYGQQRGLDAVILHDLSGGSGVLPDGWPKSTGDYTGYAGGLTPENLKDQLLKISIVILNIDGTKYPIWIDTETGVRSSDDKLFDLCKVEQFLEIAKEYVIEKFSY